MTTTISVNLSVEIDEAAYAKEWRISPSAVREHFRLYARSTVLGSSEAVREVQVAGNYRPASGHAGNGRV